MRNSQGGFHSFMEIVEQNERRIHFFIHNLGIYDQKGNYFQEGLFALWGAYQTFDETKDTFNKHVDHKIKDALMDTLTKQKRQIEKEQEVMRILQWNQSLYSTRLTSTYDPFLWKNSQSKFTINQRKWIYQTIILDKPLKFIAEKEGKTVAAIKSHRRQVVKGIRKDLDLVPQLEE